MWLDVSAVRKKVNTSDGQRMTRWPRSDSRDWGRGGTCAGAGETGRGLPGGTAGPGPGAPRALSATCSAGILSEWPVGAMAAASANFLSGTAL